MIIKPKRLHLKNFLSFEDAVFNFPDSGIYFVEGTNEDEGGSNGSGKSALFEALVYLFYDRLIRSSSSVDAVRKGCQNCEVALVAEADGKEFEICRRRGGKKELLVNQRPVSDENLINWLGIGYDEFVGSVIFGQGITKTFANSTDYERKEILSDILALSKYLRAAELCREKAKEIKEKISKIETEAAMTSALVFEKELRLKNAKGKIEEYTKELERLEMELNKNTSSLKEIDITALEDKKSALDEAYYTFNSQIAQLRSRIQLRTDRVKELEQSQSDIQNKLNQKCPVCLREITQNAVKNAVSHLNKEIEKIKQENSADVEKIKELEEELKNAEKDRAAIQNELEKAKQHNEKVRTENVRRARLESDIRMLEKIISDEEAQIGTLLKEIQDLKTELENLNREKDELVKEERIYSFWEEGFGRKGIVNMLIEPAVELLEMRTNYYLSKLSSNIQVEISTKTELKSGQVREKLSVQVINPVGAEDYNTASGGEKKRLDVAMIMALRDLIQWQSGANRMDLFVADEVFDSLDENGASRLCELLREMAGLVFVVSHNEDLKKYFPNIIRIRKKGGISEVIQ